MTLESNVQTGDLSGYEVLVGVCGGISAFKVCSIVSELTQRKAGVTVVMTPAARRFVSALTFQALSGRRVVTNLWKPEDPTDVQHIRLTDGADLLLIAPATADMIGKIASGLADDPVSTLVISFAGTVVLAPAMNERMWNSFAVKRNVALLREWGMVLVGPGSGWLACRTVGVGRMAEPGEVLVQVTDLLSARPPRSREDDVT